VKVLFLTDSLSDLDGVGRYTVCLIEHLERARPGLDVHVLLARKHRPTSAAVPKHWKVTVALPPDYFFYMTPPRFWIWYLLATWRTWRYARSVDVVHAIKDYPHNLVAQTAASLAGKPCVATAHGTYTIQPLLDERHRARASKTYQRFARIISVSRYTRGKLLKLMGSELAPERVDVIPNSVPAEEFAEPRALANVAWKDQLFTLGIGEVKERKGHHLGLAAWCRIAPDFPDWQHYIVGKLAGDEYEARLRKLVSDAGLDERVHFLGNVNEDEKIDLLQRAQCFVHTPVTAGDGGFEGFGIVYLEASAAGTPVIGTKDCGAEDAIVHESTGLLVEQTVADVSAALRRILSSAGLRHELATAGREHARASNWGANAERVLAIYDDVLKEGR